MASARLIKYDTSILDAEDSAAWGSVIDVKDFNHLVLQFSTASSANGTVKFAGAASDSAPTFSAAKSPSNIWDYVAVLDLEDSSKIDGDTGISVAGTDDTRLLMVNVDGLSYLSAQVSAHVAGAFTVKVTAFDDR